MKTLRNLVATRKHAVLATATLVLVAARIITPNTMAAECEPRLVTLEYNEPRPWPYLSFVATEPNTGIGAPYYYEDGFISKAWGPTSSESPYPNYPDWEPSMSSGGPGQLPDNNTRFLRFSRECSYEVFGLKGEIFNAVSVDLGEYSHLFTRPHTVGFVGTKADGSTVSTEFTLDGIVQFEQFQFPESFQGLIHLRATTDLCSLDNLKLLVFPPPPKIAEATASEASLWPPNGKMVPVGLEAQVEGGCGEVQWGVLGVECSEGGAENDMQIVNDHTVSLRASRSGHSEGRIYTVWLQAIDAAENLSEPFPLTVTVPHDQRAGTR